MVTAGRSAGSLSGSARLVPGALAGLVTLSLLGGLVLYWQVLAPAHPALAVPGLVAALVVLTAIQSWRALLTEDWLRRGAALAVPIGVLATLLGLYPGSACAAAAAGTCRPAGPNPFLVGVGVLATAVPVYLDCRRGSVAGEADATA